MLLARKSYDALLSRILLNPSTMSATAGLNSLGEPAAPEPTPLDHTDYPNVPFWTRKEWFDFRQKQKNVGIHSDGPQRLANDSEPSRSLAYITNELGTGITGTVAKVMRKMSRALFISLDKCGFALKKWCQCFGTCKTIGVKRVHLITNALAVR